MPIGLLGLRQVPRGDRGRALRLPGPRLHDERAGGAGDGARLVEGRLRARPLFRAACAAPAAAAASRLRSMRLPPRVHAPASRSGRDRDPSGSRAATRGRGVSFQSPAASCHVRPLRRAARGAGRPARPRLGFGLAHVEDVPEGALSHGARPWLSHRTSRSPGRRPAFSAAPPVPTCVYEDAVSRRGERPQPGSNSGGRRRTKTAERMFCVRAILQQVTVGPAACGPGGPHAAVKSCG